MYQKLLTFALTQPVIELKIEMAGVECNKRLNGDEGHYVFQIIGIVRGPLAQRMFKALNGTEEDLRASFITSKDGNPAVTIFRMAKNHHR